jgi:uncharacterized membrane protein YfcA
LIAPIAVALGAVAQGVTGLGFSLVCAPVLIAVLGPREGVRTALVLSTILNVALLARAHRDVLVREGAVLLVPAVAATPFLAWASRRIDGRVLTIVAGVLTVLSAGALLTGLRWSRGAGTGAGLAAGVVSAAMNVVGSIGGPALALYSVNAGWPPARARSTLQLIFLTSNVVAMASLGLPVARDATRWAVLLAALTAGWILGLRLHRIVAEGAARTATLGVAGLGGLVAVVRALL